MTEVKIIFTADLTPYVDGLKSMLSMTAATGQQLKPLLNVDVKAPDYSGLESQLQGIAERTRDYLKANEQATTATASTTSAEKVHTVETGKATKAVAEKSTKLRTMKRDALESFGAVSFLAVSITDLTTQLGGGSQKLEKMSRGMNDGISAGFGLAGMMGMLGIATGGWAVAIGAAVTIGVALLRFFDDSADKAQRATVAQEMWNAVIRGETRTNLENLRASLLQTQATLRNQQKDLDDQARAWTKWGLLGQIAGYVFAHGLEESRDGVKKALDSIATDINQTNVAIGNTMKSTAEVNQFIRQAETASILNQFAQQRQAAAETYKREQEEYQGHANALTAARHKYSTELKRIAEAEFQEQKQIRDAVFESSIAAIELEGKKRGDLEEATSAKVLALREQYLRAELAKRIAAGNQSDPKVIQQRQQLESEITQNLSEQIDKRKALLEKERDQRMAIYNLLVRERIALTRASGIASLQLEEQTAEDIINVRKQAAQAELNELIAEEVAAARNGEAFDEKKKLRKRELEVSLTELQVEGVEARKRTLKAEGDAWEAHHQYLIGPIAAAYDTLFNEIVNGHQRTSEVTVAMRENDYELSKIDLEKRKADLSQQLADGTISKQEYYLREKQMMLEQRQKEEEMLAFRKQLDDERKGSWLVVIGAMKDALFGALQDIGREELKEAIKSIALKIKTEGTKTTIAAASSATQAGIQIAGTSIYVVGEEAKQAANLKTAATAAVSGTTKAAESAASLPFPLNLIAIAAAIAAAVALFSGIGKSFGFEKGGRIRKGQSGYFEGYDSEIVAPEKDFVRVFREDLQPKLIQVFTDPNGPSLRNILMPQVREAVLASSTSSLRDSVREAAAEAVRGLIDVSSTAIQNPQSQGENSSAESSVILQINVDNYYGDEEHFDRVVKPGVEEAMRRIGTSDVRKLFVNRASKKKTIYAPRSV